MKKKTKVVKRTFPFIHGFIYWPTLFMSITQRKIKCNIRGECGIKKLLHESLKTKVITGSSSTTD